MADPSPLFESEADAAAFAGVQLARRLGQLPQGVSVSWSSILPGVLTERVEAQAEHAGNAAAPAMVRRYRYVIRSEDLKLAETLMDAVKSLIPTGLLIPVDRPAAAAGAIGAVVIEGLKLIKRMRAKGANLDEKSFAVLLALKANGPIAFDRFLAIMRAHDLDWSEDSLRRVLHELRAYPSRDGTGLALVQASADEGPWRTTEF